MNIAKLHIIYSLLLAHCFTLAPEDERAIIKAWDCAIVGDHEVAWPPPLPSDPRYFDYLTSPAEEYERRPVKICSMPTELQMLQACERLSKHFDLSGVPGFYYEQVMPGPGANNMRREMIADFGPWRLNLNCQSQVSSLKSQLLVPYDNGTGCIVGIQIYRNVRDRNPFLLSSRGKLGGAPAVALQRAAGDRKQATAA